MMGTSEATSVVPTVPTHTDVCMYAAEMCTCTLYGKPRHRRERRNKRAGENVLTGLRWPAEGPTLTGHRRPTTIPAMGQR